MEQKKKKGIRETIRLFLKDLKEDMEKNSVAHDDQPRRSCCNMTDMEIEKKRAYYQSRTHGNQEKS